MSNTGTLTTISAVRRALAQAKTMADILEIRDKAEAVRVYVKAIGEGLAAQNSAAEIKIRAERKAGELLREMAANGQRDGRGGDKKSNSHHGSLISRECLESLGINYNQSSRWQREALIPEDSFEGFIAKCNEDGLELTQSAVLRLAGAGHVSQANGENEWYTPPEIIDRARRVMGGIDLDPASSETAQRHVQAKRFYTIADDGLAKKWKGRVWLNPPYSKDLCPLFAAKLLEHVASVDVLQACLLVNNATETAWMQPVLCDCAAVCFPAGRIQFLDRDGQRANSPLQGQAVVYFGHQAERFAEVFADFGAVLFGHQ